MIGVSVVDSPDPATTGGALFNGIVCTPAVVSGDGGGPGGPTRNTWPGRITFAFSMLFHAARSRASTPSSDAMPRSVSPRFTVYVGTRTSGTADGAAAGGGAGAADTGGGERSSIGAGRRAVHATTESITSESASARIAGRIIEAVRGTPSLLDLLSRMRYLAKIRWMVGATRSQYREYRQAEQRRRCALLGRNPDGGGRRIRESKSDRLLGKTG